MKTLNVDNTYKINTNPTINELLQENKKIVSFIGASQSGTSFLVNNIARIMARRNFDVAILDMTQNKDSYYIYTQNKESIRVSIRNSFKDLSEGKLNGLQIENNLTVYTDVPGKNEYSARVENILETLLKKHQVVIIDTDFYTDADYFAYSEQVYLVQTMDILTIQPLTEFLSNLKSKNAINNEKIRIILNKFMNFDEITVSTLIGGMAFYNDPSMTYMQQIFEKNGVRYTTVSYNQQAYEKYIQDVANCQFTTNYSIEFRKELEMLTGGQTYTTGAEKSLNLVRRYFIMGFIGNLFKQLFGGDSSSNNSSSGSSSNTRTGSTGVSGNVSNSLKTKYKNIDGQNKLKGVLFTGLINNTNDIIDNANTKKANTKIH